MGSSLDLGDFVPNRTEAMLLDLSNNCTRELHNTFSVSLMTDESRTANDDFGQFETVDQAFWGALTLPWSPSALEGAQLPESFLSAQPDHSPPDDDSSVDPPERELQSFDASEVTSEEARVLLHYYFDKILSLSCVFDSNNNPFRYLVSGYMKSSPLIRNCVLSCSTMHLMLDDRNMHRAMVRYRPEALKCLASAVGQLKNTTSPIEHASIDRLGTLDGYVDRLQEALLALILLFNSASWLDPSDIGVNHVLSARKLFGKWLEAINGLAGSPRTIMQDRNTSFIIGAMAYYEASISFVFDQPIDAVDYLEPFCHQPETGMVFPNPWTGVSTPIFILIARVGICVRQQRAISRLQSLGWPQNVYKTVFDEVLRRVASTETRALEYEPPTRNQVLSDQRLTPNVLTELETMAYAYKLATLLELYRSFPQLTQRHDNEAPQSVERPPSPSSILSESLGLGGDFADDTTPNCQEDCKVSYKLAVNLLTLLEETAERRPTSLAHTLALIIAGSALQHLPVEKLSVSSQDGQAAGTRMKVTNMLANLNMRPQAVERWRSFVRNRLKSNADFVGLEGF